MTMTPARRKELRRKLRHLGQAWCVMCGIASTVGGLYGWLTRESDDA